MGIISLKMDFTGQSNVTPRLGRMFTTDTISKVQSVGYLDKFVKNLNISILKTDTIMVAASDQSRLFRVLTIKPNIRLIVI
jgi:hypothetical protein